MSLAVTEQIKKRLEQTELQKLDQVAFFLHKLT